MLSSQIKLTVGFLLVCGTSAYLPFANVQEFHPRPLHEFCDPAVSEGVRHCGGTTHRTLEDGGVVSLNWEMHADPDRILSLDTEQQHGVRLVKCTPSSLELILPESHARHARVGELIVASHWSHECPHLMDTDPNSQERQEGEPVNVNLYHTITKVVKHEWRDASGILAAGASKGNFAHVKVWTREIPTIAHATETIKGLAYDFNYVPIEAVQENPTQRTWDSEYQNGQWLDDVAARRLQSAVPTQFNAGDFERPMDTFKGGGIANPNSDIQYRVDGGHPVLGGKTVTSDDVKSLLNMQPKKVANFGWNWDFKVNASQDISFNYTTPGTKMYVIIKKPYIKAHSSLRFRFRSYMPNENAEDTFFTDNTWVSLKKHTSQERASVFEHWTPRVKWEASMDGNADVSGGILAQMNAQESASSNPLELIQMPVLQDFWKPKWFGTIDFPMGNIPVSLTPGIQFKAKFFHYGDFRGSLSLGLKAKPVYKPKLQFDSYTGLRMDLNLQMKEVTITPPNWMVSTSHFECGIALEPTIWVKGHLGSESGGRRLSLGGFHRSSLANTKVAAALRPYFNMTISRAGHKEAPGDERRELVVYPFRVVGLPVDKNKRWKVRIETKLDSKYCKTGGPKLGGKLTFAGQRNRAGFGYSASGNKKPYCDRYKHRMDTTEALNWGELEFHDPVDRFNWGVISQYMLTKMEITMQIVEVDYSTGTRRESQVSTPKKLPHSSIINGVWQPSPTEVDLTWGGEYHVKVYLHGLWMKTPAPWFAKRIRGVGISFPEVIVNKEYISEISPDFNISDYYNTGWVAGAGAKKPLTLQLRHASKKFPVLLDKHNGYVPGMNSSSLTTKQILEMGASFLSNWERVCFDATTGCDPEIILYHGSTEIAKAQIPQIAWNTHEQLQGTIHNVIGATTHSTRVVPVTVALQPTKTTPKFAKSARVGLIRMKFAIANPDAWNRFVSPYTYTPVQEGTSFKLIWSINNAKHTTPMKFTLVTRKGLPKTAAAAAALTINGTVATGSKYLRPEMGPKTNSKYFNELSSQEITVTPVSETIPGGMQRVRFEYNVQFTGAAVGETVMVSVAWNDDFGDVHTMYAPPFLMQSSTVAAASNDATKTLAANAGVAATASAPTPAVSVAATPAVAPAPAAAARRLGVPTTTLNPLAKFMQSLSPLTGDGGWTRNADGTWSHKHHGAAGGIECEQKDLNFAFGAGLMFRAYAKHLTFPSDIPVLGAISDAPEIGTPWTMITGWQSKSADLASKLPELLCRHGVCSATLPGCPAYNAQQKFFSDIKIRFQHTVKYPKGAKNAALATALKQGLSYAFAVLPEAMTIAIHYVNQTVVPGTLSPKSPTGAANHRRRYQQYHNVMLGTDACENRGYDAVACKAVGCCQYDSLTLRCDSAVGNGPCLKTGVTASANLLNPAAKNAVPVAPGLRTQTGPVIAAPQVAAKATAAAAAATGTAVTPAPVANLVPAANPLPPTVVPGPVIQPLTGGRRLESADDEDDAEDTELEEDSDDDEKEEHVETRMHSITVSFKNGLKYKVDNTLLNEMMSEGLFMQLEDVDTQDDKPVRIHSFEIHDRHPSGNDSGSDSGSEFSQKDAVPEEVRGVVNSGSSHQVLVTAALACCTLLGVALLLRRTTSRYQRVEETTEPVE